MLNMKNPHLRIREGMHLNKAPSLMGVWGLLLMLGGAIQQFVRLDLDTTLIMWGVLTVIGVAGQVVCMVRGLGKNFGVWMLVIAVGWFFTLYILKFDKGGNIQYVDDLPAIWLGLIGLGYVATAFQINSKFWRLATVSFLFGEVMELSLRGVLQLDFFIEYDKLLFGIYAGVPLIIASLPQYYRPPQRKPAPAPTPPAPATIQS